MLYSEDDHVVCPVCRTTLVEFSGTQHEGGGERPVTRLGDGTA